MRKNKQNNRAITSEDIQKYADEMYYLLFVHAQSYLRNWHDAEEVVQMAWTVATVQVQNELLKRHGGRDAKNTLLRYMPEVVRRISLNQHGRIRTYQERITAMSDAMRGSTGSDKSSDGLTLEDREALQQAILRIQNPVSREIIERTCLGHDPIDIIRDLDLGSRANGYRKIKQAIQELAEIFRELVA